MTRTKRSKNLEESLLNKLESILNATEPERIFTDDFGSASSTIINKFISVGGHFKCKEYEQANKDLLLLSNWLPKHALILYYTPYSFYKLNDLEGAKKYLKIAFENDSSISQNKFINILKKSNERLEELTKSVTLEPDANKFYELSQIHLELDDFFESRTHINNAIRLDRNNSEYHFLNAKIQYLLNDFSKSASEAKKAEKLGKNDFEINNLKIITYFKSSFSKWRAKKLVNELLESDEYSSEKYYLNGLLNFYAGDKDKSIIFFEECLKNNQEPYTILHYLGHLYEQKQDYEQAISCYSKINSDYPGSTWIFDKLVNLSEKINDQIVLNDNLARLLYLNIENKNYWRKYEKNILRLAKDD